MKILLFVFAIIFLSVNASLAQTAGTNKEDSTIHKFEEVQGRKIVITTTEISGFDEVLAHNNEISEKDKDEMLMLSKNNQLHPTVSFYADNTSFLKPVILVRIPDVPTCVLGFSLSARKFYLNLQEDSITNLQMATLIANYLKPYAGNLDFSTNTLLTSGYDWVVNEIAENSDLRTKINKETVKKINKYFPVRCTAFSPISGVAVFQVSVNCFLPFWKDNLIDRFTESATKGKFNLSSMDRMSESAKQKMHKDFLSAVDRYIIE